MRLLPLVIALLWIATPLPAFAKPKTKIAIAPLAGDPGGKITQAVVDALAGKDFVVVGPKDTKRELTKIGANGELTAKDVRKVLAKLDAVALIDGKVGKAGAKKTLHLEVHRRGQESAGFTVEFKTTTSAGFRRGVHDEVMKKVDGASEDSAEEPKSLAASSDDDATTKRKPALADDDSPTKRKPLADDDAPTKRKPVVADDAPKPKPKRKQVAEPGDDDGTTKVRKHGKALADSDQPPLQHVHLGVGPSVSQRRLSWATRGGFMQAPPPVITSAAGARIDGELYPFSFGDAPGGGAGLGLAVSYDKSFGLKIQVPGGAAAAPIDQAHYAIGARYRFAVGEASSLALGFDYFGRTYVADRTALKGAVLDTPDFKYAAISPGITGRTPLSPTISLYGGLDGLLMLDAGPVVLNNSYGKGTVYGVEARAGLDIALSPNIDLRFAAEYSQINLAFGTGGTLATGRDNDPSSQDVMGATDRSLGVAGTLGLVY
ncbi:MAG TPA: hypothetical protein VGC42_09520 [Kofleriaceae bacterium]